MILVSERPDVMAQVELCNDGIDYKWWQRPFMKLQIATPRKKKIIPIFSLVAGCHLKDIVEVNSLFGCLIIVPLRDILSSRERLKLNIYILYIY